MTTSIETIVVGIPARDEEATIRDCLSAVVAAAAHVDASVVVGVAADGCRDRTVERAASVLDAARRVGFDGVVVRTSGRAAGAARRAAVDAALAAAGGAPDNTWIVTTDADTIVAPNWLAAHLAWARTGIAGVAGLVGVAWGPGSSELADRYRASIVHGGTGIGHIHVHGANLGVRADWWLTVGGCGDASTAEDHELWRRLRAAGAELLGVDDLVVTTSARLAGRAPDGFARYLSDLLDESVG